MSTPFSITQRLLNGYPIVEVCGEVDLSTASEFKSAIHKIVEDGHKHIIIDMSQISYMDSSGFGVLLGACKRVHPQNGTIRLVGCNPIISRMLNITRLDILFQIYGTLEEALKEVPNNPIQEDFE